MTSLLIGPRGESERAPWPQRRYRRLPRSVYACCFAAGCCCCRPALASEVDRWADSLLYRVEPNRFFQLIFLHRCPIRYVDVPNCGCDQYRETAIESRWLPPRRGHRASQWHRTLKIPPCSKRHYLSRVSLSIKMRFRSRAQISTPPQRSIHCYPPLAQLVFKQVNCLTQSISSIR